MVNLFIKKSSKDGMLEYKPQGGARIKHLAETIPTSRKSIIVQTTLKYAT
jgi:hypothetical protein